MGTLKERERERERYTDQVLDLPKASGIQALVFVESVNECCHEPFDMFPDSTWKIDDYPLA